MAVYQFTAMNSSGQEVKDEVEANSNDEAIAKIRGPTARFPSARSTGPGPLPVFPMAV